VKHRVAILMDKSSSMAGSEAAVVSSYNEQVSQCQINAREGDEVLVTLITYNGNVYEHFVDRPAAELELASVEGYEPCGATNIWDAIGHAIDLFGGPDDGECRFLVCNITDGDQTVTPHKWPRDRVAGAVRELQRTGRWTFTFLGCSPTVLQQVAEATGIPLSNMRLWSNTAGANRAARSSAAPATALGTYFDRARRGDAGAGNFYTSSDDRLADFSTGQLLEVLSHEVARVWQPAPTMSAARVGAGPLRSAAVADNPADLAGAVQDLPAAELKVGLADVFGSSRRV